MKIARKTLSVFLSFLMMMSACSVAFTGLSFSAAAASSYSVSDVKSLVSAASSAAASTSSSSNSWAYTGDDGSVLAAAEAVYDYATGAVRVSGSTGNYNSSDTLSARVNSLLSYSSGNNYNLVKNLIYPTGTTVYGYSNKQSNSGDWTETSSSYSYSVGADVTSNSNVSYNANVTTSTVTKTSSVTVDVNSYLLTLDSIDDVPTSFNTKVTYKYTHAYGRSATVTARSTSWIVRRTYSYTAYNWNYISSVSRTVNSTNTTARSTLDSYANYFTDERLATTVEELLANNTAAELQSLYNEAYAMYYTTMIGSGATFSTAVINHFFDTDAIVEYINNVEFAMQVALAQPNMQILLDCIENGYDVNDIDDMTTVYTTASNAYDVVASYDDDVIAYVIANYDGYEDFSLTACEEFLDELYYQIELYQLRVLKAAIDADIEEYSQYLEDPEDTEDITDLELAALADKFTGYKKTLSGYSSEAIAEVFTDGTSYIDDFRSSITLKINTRDAQVEYTNWYTYFLPYIFANITLWTNEEILTRYEEDSDQYADLVSDYNSWVSTIGSEIASSVFTLTYNDEDTLLTDAVADYLARLKTNIKARNDAQLETIETYKDMSTTIDFSNFIGVKTAVDRFDQDLYDEALALGLVDSTHKAIYNSISSLLTAYNSFVASGGLPYTQTHYHDSEGVYVTRYAGDQEDSNGNQIGYENDLARDNEDNDGDGEADDNYVVDEAAVNETIVKLDNFITSKDFSSLVGLEDDDGNAYNTLSEAIEDILVKNIFTNDMVNMLVAMMFPLLCDTIEDLLSDLSTLGVDGIEKSSDSNASAYVNLNAFNVSFSFIWDFDVTGGLDLYMGGYNGTETYAELLSDLGAYVYPSTFATYLSSNSTYKTKYASIITALNKAGTDWTNLVGSDGETDLTFDWGVTDYSSFTTAMGAVFGSLGDLLQTILVGKSYSKTTADNAANIIGTITVSSDGFAAPTFNPNVDSAYASATIGITPLTLFKDLWVPVLEACGIASSDITVPSSSASTATIVKNMFDPIMTLIETLANAPIETLCDMLPQLFYALSMDKMQDLIDSITITASLKLTVTEAEITGQNVISSAGYALLNSTLVSVINNQLDPFEFSIGLDMLNLQDMLGFEYTNINTLLDYIFEMLGYDLQLPIMNAGEIIVCSSYSYVTSKRSSGTRLKLEADTTDVFYVILKYLVNAVGDTDFMQNIVAFIQNMDSDDGGSAVELPDIVYTIIGNVNSSADDALAALVELFCPQVYDTAEYEWYESAYTYNGIDGTSAESIVYLTYGNDWTADKAQYFVDNVDDLLQTVLEMAGTEVTDINVWLQEAISGLFNNENLTGVVKGLATLGVMFNSDFVYDLIAEQTGVELRTWYNAFGYLFSDIDEEYGTTAVAPDETGYEGIDGVTATATETVNAETGETETSVTWYIDGVEFEDGNREQFLSLFCSICDEMAPLISMFFTGEDMTLFADAITITGYGSYANSVGLVFEMLGMTDVLDQDEYAAMCSTDGDAAAFEYLCNQLFDWLDDFLSGNTVKNIIDLLPNLVYFIESNGLYTMLHNLLMPLLVLVDDIRPILDIDLNAILSVILSELLNYGTVDFNNVLNLLAGTYEDPAETDPDYKYYEIDISDLTLDSIVKLIDQYLGTNFYDSQLVSPGLDALCAGRVEYDSVIGTAYYASMSTADALTITLSAVLESLEFVVDEDTGETNGDIICALIDSMLEEPVAAEVYAAVVDLIGGIDAEYADINWDYMFDVDTQATAGEQITLPEHSIVYLGYSTDWTEDTADAVDSALNSIIELVLDSVADGQTIAQLINSVLNDNVYSDANLDAIVELIANAIGGLDSSLYELVDVVIDTDIASWFTMCEETTDENGDTVFVCTYDWDIDDATTEDEKKELFISGLCTTLEPAEELIAWLMFGDDYAFFTGTEVDDDGNYIYNDIITISGGRGYDLGIVPLLEALGCEVQGADYYKQADGSYDVTGAVSDVINSVFALVDEISGDPATEAFDLLANLIYFINADGLKVCMSNLLLPVDSILETLSPLVSSDGEDVSIGALLEDALGFNICDLTMETLLTLASDAGFVMSSEMVQILCTFYIGELECFTSANGNYAYRMVYTDEESRADMLTIVLSFAVEAFKLNADLFTELLGEETYNAVMEIISGVDEWFYADPNWAYAYGDDEDALAQLAADGLPERTEENSIVYTQYTNNWNKVTSDYLDDNLTEIICMITDLITDDGSSLGTFLDDAISGGLYQDSILNSMIELVVGMIADFDEELVNAVGAVIGVDIEEWFDYCTFSEDEEDNTVVTCDYDWGIDSQTTNEAKKEAFVAAFTEALEPVNRLIDWLFFGDSYTFFNSSTGEVLITIAGGEGYNYAIVPILEALGCEPKAASEYQNADGSYNTSEAVADVFTAITDFLSDICGDLENAQNGGAVEAILDVLPNIVYFINADGLSVALQNLLIPVTYILDALEPVGVEIDLNELVGIDLSELNFSLVFDILESSLGIYLPETVQTFISTFYMGAVESFTSANGRTAYRMVYTEEESRAEMTTILISIVLEAFKYEDNETALKDLLGDYYEPILAILQGAESDFDYEDPNWAYMYDGDLDKLIADNLPGHSDEDQNSIVYTQYTNNWNEETADYLDENLSEIIQMIVDAVRSDGSTVGELLDAAITDGLYQDKILNALLEEIVKLLAGLDSVLVGAIGAVLDVDIDTWFEWCEIERDADGNVVSVTSTHDWGIDAKTTNEEKKAQFVAAFVEALEPANQLLAWLFFGEDYTFFNSSTGEDLITISGGEGYDYAIVPILEALGCTMGYSNETGIKPASAYYDDETGSYDVTQAVEDVFTSLTDLLSDICGDLATGEDALDVMLELLPNVVYFINADGVKNSVNNLLAPVYYLLEVLTPLTGEINLDDLINFPLSDITFYAIFDILEDRLGLHIDAELQEFVATFYMGEVESFTSAVDSKTAYRMVYSEDESRADMITILISLVLDVFKDSANESVLSGWLGSDNYTAVVKLLSLTEAKAMQDFSWYYTEYADTDETFSAIETSTLYTDTYNEYWTQEKAQYIADNLEAFIGNTLCLLGLEIDGVEIESLDDIMDALVSGSLYTQDNADAIISLLSDLMAQISELEPYGQYIGDVLDSAFGIDITAWDNMTVTVADGDRESFEDALVTILAPIAPLFKVLLAGEDISFFLDFGGNDQIIIPGSEGYAYGIIPLLEALGCDNILTPDEFKALLASDEEAAIKAVLDPLFNKVDDIMADPVDEILELLPPVIYFINSNGLDTCVKNILNSVDTVIEALEPIIGETDIMSLLGVDLSTYDFEWIVSYALDAVYESTGYDLTPVAMNAISELTVGKVITYESKNGETYYTMVYDADLSKADMVTIVLRIAIDFITMDENIEKIEGILAEYIPDEDNYKAACSLIESLAEKVKEDPGMGQALYVLYYIYYGISTSLEFTDDVYHDVNNSWQFILKLLSDSDEPILSGFSTTLQNVLNTYFDGIFDSEGIASDGAVTFFQKIIAFFQKIIDFFKNLFGIE